MTADHNTLPRGPKAAETFVRAHLPAVLELLRERGVILAVLDGEVDLLLDEGERFTVVHPDGPLPALPGLADPVAFLLEVAARFPHLVQRALDEISRPDGRIIIACTPEELEEPTEPLIQMLLGSSRRLAARERLAGSGGMNA